MDKSELLCPVGGNVNWCSHYEKWYIWKFPSKTKVELPYNQAILLLGIYPKKGKTLIQKDSCRDVAGSPVVRTQCFHWGGRVQSMVRELRCYEPHDCSQKKKRYTPMFTAALFTNNQDTEATYMSING